MPLFGKSQKSPAELVKALKEAVNSLERGDKKAEKAQEDVSKNLVMGATQAPHCSRSASNPPPLPSPDADNFNEVENSPGEGSSKATTTRRPRDPPQMRAATQQMDAAFSLLHSVANKPSVQKEDDEFDFYAKLLAKRLRQVPPDACIDLMHTIDTLMYEANKNTMRSSAFSQASSSLSESLSPIASEHAYTARCDVDSHVPQVSHPATIPLRDISNHPDTRSSTPSTRVIILSNTAITPARKSIIERAYNDCKLDEDSDDI